MSVETSFHKSSEYFILQEPLAGLDDFGAPVNTIPEDLFGSLNEESVFKIPHPVLDTTALPHKVPNYLTFCSCYHLIIQNLYLSFLVNIKCFLSFCIL